MVKTISVERMRKIKKAVPQIEKKVKVHFTFHKNKISFKGNELNEFLVEEVVRALEFGFDIEDSLLLLEDDYDLKFINIKEHTKRKNLHDVRSRVIGRRGKAIRTIENLSDSRMVVQENQIGLIVNSSAVEMTMQAIESLIQGSKHGNIYSYLEKQRSNKDRRSFDDLGLKDGVHYLDEE